MFKSHPGRRLHLRNTGLQASSAEADALFDSWDGDGGGSLDMKELKSALVQAQHKAKQWEVQRKYDPVVAKAKALRQQAKLAEEATAITAQAEALEEELKEMKEHFGSRADIRLGALLFRRRIKPGAVVTTWAKSKGVHAGELSRKEFREEVQNLGLAATGPNATSPVDIDNVFATFDEDGGGYMDAEEAKAMVSGLLKRADDAEHEIMRKERITQKMRAQAGKKAALAQKPVEEDLGPAQPLPSSGDEVKKKKKRKPILSPEVREAVTVDETPSTTLSLDTVKVGLMDAIFSTPRSKQRRKNAEAKKRATVEAMHRAASRLFGVELSIAWNTWVWHYNETLHIRERIERASSVLMNPLVMRALAKWREWYYERHTSLKAMKKAMHNMSMAAEIEAFRIWVSRAKSLGLHRTAVIYHERLKRIKLVRAFNAWSQQQLYDGMQRNLKANKICSAFAFWVRIKVCSCLLLEHKGTPLLTRAVVSV